MFDFLRRKSKQPKCFGWMKSDIVPIEVYYMKKYCKSCDFLAKCTIESINRYVKDVHGIDRNEEYNEELETWK